MKKKPRTELALEIAAQHIAQDAIVSYPKTDDPVDLVEWGKALRQVIIEVAKRRDMAFQPTYKEMPVEEVAVKMLQLSWEKVGELRKLENRKAGADLYLSLQPEGEPPMKPESSS